jgi:alkanesulfonate monooxygenase SsuD/methylene tetrahydromethanopterin reductase-like flavin-dependent oxidoreductase (luciferase family)
MYRDYFRPSRYFAEPKALIAVSAVCADSDERAAEIARPVELSLLRLRQGRFGQLSTIAEATDYPYTAEERQVIAQNRDRLFVGAPSTVRERLLVLADRVGVEEIMVTSLIYDHADRRRSYELLADAFALSPLGIRASPATPAVAT